MGWVDMQPFECARVPQMVVLDPVLQICDDYSYRRVLHVAEELEGAENMYRD